MNQFRTISGGKTTVGNLVGDARESVVEEGTEDSNPNIRDNIEDEVTESGQRSVAPMTKPRNSFADGIDDGKNTGPKSARGTLRARRKIPSGTQRNQPISNLNLSEQQKT